MKKDTTTKPDTLAKLFDESVSRFADLTASSFYDGTRAYTYNDVRLKVQEESALLSRYGIAAGDRVILISENCPEWTIAFFSVVNYGRIIVPVLSDCSANEVNNILNHSESKAAFVSTKQLAKFSEENRNKLKLIVNIDNWEVIKADESCTPDYTVKVPEPDDLCAILYTSGTSGNAKGVMLSNRNFCFNVAVAPNVEPMKPGSVWLSFLPMAHTYELSLGTLYPFSTGCIVYYLKKAPSPSTLIAAFKVVHPQYICSVPLIIEKIYRKSVQPTIRASKPLTWMEKHTPGLMYRIIGNKLKRTFGGRLVVLAIGGAKLDSEVESFLEKAHFPYAIGYGLTETAPLVCAAARKKTMVGSTGPALPGVKIKLLNTNPETGIGELVVKGPNVMLGYYKDPERTAEAFTPDGWFRTKDLALYDARGRVSIKGRLGNMILGASGENIYPEEIEMVINGIEGVEESLVKSESGRLVAMVKLADDRINWAHEGSDPFLHQVNAVTTKIMEVVNMSVNKASKIARVELVREAFEKTATKKIRRFKYSK